MHCTNLFPLLSPAACYAAKREGIPVVQALRNFRLGCPNALLFREGRVCEICLREAVPWPAVGHACYRSSRAASATVAAMLSVHRAIGTWRRAVNVFFTASEFARAKLIECGIPATRILTKANFVHPDPVQLVCMIYRYTAILEKFRETAMYYGAPIWLLTSSPMTGIPFS